MLGGLNLLNTLLINVILGVVWHFGSLFLCVKIDHARFSPEKRLYRPHRWEKEGRFYSDVLRINKWKDRLPQHIGKDGFSKSHLDNISIEYLDRFIAETCRGEWNHALNCMFFVVLLSINSLFMGLLLSALLFAGNLPFICIQRYNRFRLQKLRRMIMRKKQRQTERKPSGETGAAVGEAGNGAVTAE